MAQYVSEVTYLYMTIATCICTHLKDDEEEEDDNLVIS